MKTGDKVRDPNFPEDGIYEFDEKRDRSVAHRLILVTDNKLSDLSGILDFSNLTKEELLD